MTSADSNKDDEVMKLRNLQRLAGDEEAEGHWRGASPGRSSSSPPASKAAAAEVPPSLFDLLQSSLAIKILEPEFIVPGLPLKMLLTDRLASVCCRSDITFYFHIYHSPQTNTRCSVGATLCNLSRSFRSRTSCCGN